MGAKGGYPHLYDPGSNSCVNIHSYRAEAIDHLTRLHGAIEYNPRLNLLFAADGEAFEIRLTPGGYLIDRVMPQATKGVYKHP